MKLKKPIKIIVGIVIFLTLPSLLFLGYLYYNNHTPLPQGTESKAADQMATKMLMALNYEAFVGTDYIEWTFKNRRHYKWFKNKKKCEVYWESYKVRLHFDAPETHKAFVHGFTIDGELGKELVGKAEAYFKNDVFWLTGPFQVFEKGVKRAVAVTEHRDKGLLVTYNDGKSYLWQLDETGLPLRCNMWDAQTPINGLQATWEQWKVTETGIKLPQFHKILFFGSEITDIKTE